MSSDLYVQSIARGDLKVRRRKHVSGEVMVYFNDPNMAPIHITDNQVIDVGAHGVDSYAIARSNIRTLIGMGYLEVVM